MRIKSLPGFICFLVGLLLLGGYWYSVQPLSYRGGYAEDMCGPDMVRHLMADSIREAGHPKFTTDQFMTPQGMSVPYFSWAPERDWVGAYVWDWNADFPFLWAYFGVSLLLTFIVVGFILIRMGLIPPWAWTVATAVVIFHVPRHYKIWKHFEHLPQHWIYISLFLDAWLWQKFWRDRRWSWKIELWRALAGVGMLGTVGYFWGPLILEWLLVHVGILWIGFSRNRRGIQTEIESFNLKRDWTAAALPLALITAFLCAWVRWYVPLFREVQSAGEVNQGLSWFAGFSYFLRPLWLDFFTHALPPIDTTETVVTIGWFYWIPFLFALYLVRKKRGGPGLGIVAPFLIFLASGVLYASWQKPFVVQKVLQAVIPFMKFFRVASRWGLFLPEIVTVIIVLAWPELAAEWKRLWNRSRSRPIVVSACALFIIFSSAEMTFMLTPVNMMPAISPGLADMLEKIRTQPGTTVLDLPFCVAGGNGVCTYQQCPNYPKSTVGLCLRNWHDKKVYGIYASRLLNADCEIYNKAPYTRWFNAWGQQRCFNTSEWDEFCSYLDEHKELSAVLLYPDVWSAVGRSRECSVEFERHLGAPLAGDRAMTLPTRGGEGSDPTRVFWFAPHCKK